MKIKTSDLIGPALARAVAKSEGVDVVIRRSSVDRHMFLWLPLDIRTNGGCTEYSPSTNWSQGGPIIERAGINVMLRYGSLPPNHVQDTWDALIKPEFYTSGRPESGVRKEIMVTGPTPLIAAMRCYVASKLGDEVEIPDNLI